MELALLSVLYGTNGLRVSYKQSSRCVLQCVEKFLKIYRKTPVLESLFYYRENPAHAFSSQRRKTFQNNFFMDIIKAVIQRNFTKQRFCKISQNLQENTCTGITFLSKFNPAQVFSSEFHKIFQNDFLWILKIVSKFCF